MIYFLDLATHFPCELIRVNIYLAPSIPKTGQASAHFLRFVVEAAMRMLEDDISIETISKYTGLTEKEVKALMN